MNPIITTLADYFGKSQRVTRVELDNRLNPKAIVVHLEDGSEVTHSIDAKNREQFMNHWKQASAWFRIHWENLDE